MTATAQAEPEVWTDLGLNGGSVQALAVHPTNPNIIYSGIYNGRGLFRSIDGAASWQALEMAHNIEGEDTFENQSVTAVAVAPGNPQVVWVAHDYWVAKSTDGGNTWAHITNDAMQKNCLHCAVGENDQLRICHSIAIDPNNAETVYVGTSGPEGARANGAVFRTTDGGATWEKLNGGENLDYSVTSIVLDPRTPGVIWCTTNSWGAGNVWDGRAYRSTDNGQSFALPQRPIRDSGIAGLTLHPDNPNVVFISAGFGVARAVIEGSTWEPVIAVDGSALAAPVAFAPSDGNVAYAGWNRPNAWGGDGLPKLSRTRDGGLTWETLSLDPALASNAFCIVVDPLQSNTLYWGDLTGGVIKSEDGGLTWRPVNKDLEGVVVKDVDTDLHDSSHLIAGTTAGVYERVNGTWHKRLNWSASSVKFDPRDSQTYYAGSSYMLAKTLDSGATWQFSQDTANGLIVHIDIDPNNTDRLFFADASHIRRSMDGGNTFTAVLEGINSEGQHHDMNVVVIDPANPQRILAGGGNYLTPRITGNLWESLDGGETWQITGLTNTIVNDILIHPENPDILYAGCGFNWNQEIPLLKSTDGGKNWAAAMTGMPLLKQGLKSIWANESGVAFAVGDQGVIVHATDNRIKTHNEITDKNLHDVFGVTVDTLFAVGDSGTILRYDGTAWSGMPAPSDADLTAIWGSSPDRLYAVGAGGQILSYDGLDWSVMPSPTSARLNDLFGTRADAAVAIGDGGALLHYDGTTWTLVESPTTEDLLAVWGGPDGRWFAVGENGTIVTFDKITGSLIPNEITGTIYGVWGDFQGGLFAVTANPGILWHYDGIQWRSTAAPMNNLSDIWGVSESDIYVAENNGGILRYDGNKWETLRPAGSRFRSVTDLEFHHSNPDVIYAATANSGIFLSPDGADNWLNLGSPRLSVNAIAVGSLYAATEGGLYQLTGTGVLAGQVYDTHTHGMISGARVTTDMGLHNLTIDGHYMLVVPAGIFDTYATADQYEMAVVRDVTVSGGDITWKDFEMQSGILSGAAPEGTLTIDQDNSGGGSYCFISALDAPKTTPKPLWIPIILATGSVLAAGLKSARRYTWIVLLCAAGLACMSPQAMADTIFQQVGVSSPPLPVGSGARAMGMGGAFIATADDATAASWNPAGLVQLERPEISVVVDGYWRNEAYASDEQPEIGNTARNEHGNLNYLSATFPVQWHKHLVLSVNYQRLYDFHRDLNFQRNLSEMDLQLSQQVQFNQSGTLGAVGLAAASEITPRLSLGLTVNIWTDQLGYDNGWKAQYQETATGSQAGVATQIHTSIRDAYEKFRGINFTLGALWDLDRLGGLGVVVNTPFTATIQHHYRFEQQQTFGSPLDSASSNGPVQIDEEVELHLPLSYGMGWSKRLSDQFTLGVDIYRSEWSDYYLKDGRGKKFSPIDGRPSAESDVDATTHLRMGGEYLLLLPHRKWAVPIRLGLFYDPEPSEGKPEEIFGIAMGSGITTPKYSIDLAYQYRWAEEIDTGNIIAGSTADIDQHTVLVSLIYYY